MYRLGDRSKCFVGPKFVLKNDPGSLGFDLQVYFQQICISGRLEMFNPRLENRKCKNRMRTIVRIIEKDTMFFTPVHPGLFTKPQIVRMMDNTHQIGLINVNISDKFVHNLFILTDPLESNNT